MRVQRSLLWLWFAVAVPWAAAFSLMAAMVWRHHPYQGFGGPGCAATGCRMIDPEIGFDLAVGWGLPFWLLLIGFSLKWLMAPQTRGTRSPATPPT